MSKKDFATLIRNLNAQDEKVAQEAAAALKVLSNPAGISGNEDRDAFLDKKNPDWVSCQEGAKVLRDSGKDEDAKALIWFAHQLFQSGKRLSYLGTEENVDIRRQEIKAYDRVLEINPSHGSCLNNQGITYMQLEDWTPAIGCFEKAVKAEPGYEPEMQITSTYYKDLQTKALANLAICYWNIKKFEEALKAIEEAAENSSENVETRDYMRQHMPYRKITLS